MLPPRPSFGSSTPFMPENMSANASTANALNKHMAELASVKRPLDNDSLGNVLAIVRFPQDDVFARSCDGKLWQDVRIRMSYEKLMSLGSTKIRNMLTPQAQARFRRRFGPNPVPPGIDYIVDFTPPAEGPELAELTAALWLPRMVKIWFLAGQYLPDAVLEAGQRIGIGFTKRPLADKAVGSILTLGHDDVCKNIGCFADMSSWQAQEKKPGIFEENSPDGQNHIPAFRRIEDYCPIRHRAAIVRVLRGINGEGFLLNSAARMWTVAQVAIYLEVPQVVVDPVAQWLVAPPNTKFIEVAPEVAYRLAYALKIPSVLTAAFRILVNEFAVDYAVAIPSPRRDPLTWAQRRRDDYGDYPSDPIEYASRSFADRMTGTLAMLQSDDVFDRLPVRIPEWDVLQYFGTLIEQVPPEQQSQSSYIFAPEFPSRSLAQVYRDLTGALLGVFHEHIKRSLKINILDKNLGDLVDAQRAHYIPNADRTPLNQLYDKLTREQKALTPFFWESLQSLGPVQEYSYFIHEFKTLLRWSELFNVEVAKAVSNNVIRPSPDHPSLAHHEHFQLKSKWVPFNLSEFHGQLFTSLRHLASHIVPALPHRNLDSDTNGIPFFLSDHLLIAGLNENELNYLPIWADGLDDGSGGVFQEAIPPAEMGPSEPGPGYHTGWTAAATETDRDMSTLGSVDFGDERMSRYAPSTVMAPSDLGMGVLSLGSTMDADSKRSLAANRSGTGTVTTATGKGINTPSGSESFLDDAGSSVYADARFAHPAGHQVQGRAIEEYVLAEEMEEEEEEGEGKEEGGERMEDGFGLGVDSDEGMEDFDDDDEDDDDGTSTLDGFEEVGMDTEGEGEGEERGGGARAASHASAGTGAGKG